MMPVNPVPELVSTRSARSSPSCALTHHSHDACHPQPLPRARLDAIRSARSSPSCNPTSSSDVAEEGEQAFLLEKLAQKKESKLFFFE
eukprot:1244760-Rhodomonas_salina.1